MNGKEAVFHIGKIKMAFEKEFMETESEALQMGIDAIEREEIQKDLLSKALDSEWQEEHRRLGFATSINDLMNMLGGEEKDETD